jgi:hypothetical protein
MTSCLLKPRQGSGQWDVKRHRLHTMLGWLKSIFLPQSLPSVQQLLSSPDVHGDPSVAPFQIFNSNVLCAIFEPIFDIL